MKQVRVLKGFFFSLLLSLVFLPIQNTSAQQVAGSHSLGMLAYIEEGDLWVKLLPSGRARRLTTSGLTTAPGWSPSGQWLAYLKDSKLWVVRSSGTNARALSPSTKVHTFAWSPVSEVIAYVTHAGSLHVAGVSEQQDRELIAGNESKERVRVSSVAWSPRGKWLGCIQEKLGKEGQELEQHAGLWRMQADGSKAKELFNTGTPAQDGLIVAGWSLDDQYILIWPVHNFSSSLLADGTSLMAIPAGGSKPRELVRSMLAFGDFLAWSPDGRLLAVTEGSGRETWSHKRLAVVELASGTLTYLTDDKTAALFPAWTPDGQRIAYVAAPDRSFGGGKAAKTAAAERRIWVMRRDGSEKRQLTHDVAYQDERPRWSAEGSHILFARLDRQNRASLWLMRNAGSELQQVAELSPAPEWFGYYGYINWDSYFAWWPGTSPRPLPGTE
jgi:Tol biopolymer transport system component